MPLCPEHKRFLHADISQPINTFLVTIKQQNYQFRCMAFKLLTIKDSAGLNKCFTNIHDCFRETMIQDRELHAFIDVDKHFVKTDKR